jgi:hypothetical protein
MECHNKTTQKLHNNHNLEYQDSYLEEPYKIRKLTQKVVQTLALNTQVPNNPDQQCSPSRKLTQPAQAARSSQEIHQAEVEAQEHPSSNLSLIPSNYPQSNSSALMIPPMKTPSKRNQSPQSPLSGEIRTAILSPNNTSNLRQQTATGELTTCSNLTRALDLLANPPRITRPSEIRDLQLMLTSLKGSLLQCSNKCSSRHQRVIRQTILMLVRELSQHSSQITYSLLQPPKSSESTSNTYSSDKINPVFFWEINKGLSITHTQ